MKFTRTSFLVLLLIAHLGLIFILFFGNSAQVLTTMCLFVFECLFCSTAIYHRLLSHRSWNAPRWVEVVGTSLGIFTFTGTPITRTLSHRYHHRYADEAQDPHSPRVLGLFLAYWPMLQKNRKMSLRLVDDLISDPLHRFCHLHYLKIIIVVFLAVSLATDLTWATAIVIAPGALCWMNISICNIFCHLGKEEAIVNNRVLSLMTFGEGWHKNHHVDPLNPNFGIDKFDAGYWVTRLLGR